MDENNTPTDNDAKRKRIYYKDGKFYFDKKTERTFYFALTMLVLIFGVLTKCGVFS